MAVENNPVGKTYVAKLPETPFSPIDVEGNVKGSVTATSGAGGKGVDFKVKLSNFPTEGGPFCKSSRQAQSQNLREDD